jgi:predicted secreted protein
MIYIRPLVIAFFVAFVTTKTAIAHETPQSYDRINFQVSAIEEVENDTLVVVMYSERSGQEPSAIADEVNRNIGWAVDLAKKNSAVKVQTLNYRQDPLYKNQSISGWKVRQSIHLESTEVASLSALLGELQSRLSVASLRYTVSPTRRDKVESRLIAEALNRFKSRGEQITVELGRSGYRIVNLDVITSGRSPAPVRMRSVAMMADSSAVAAPSIEPGVQTVSVQVSGAIELNIPQ